MKSRSLQNSYQLTRIAPTPSGFLHLGNVFSFALTARLAHESGAGLLLRIDDMDSDRVTAGYVQDVFDTLVFMDIPWTSGPRDAQDFSSAWSQHTRLHLYEAALSSLRDDRKIYACKCSRRALRTAGVSGCLGDCRSAAIDLDSPDVSWRVSTGSEVMVDMQVQGGVNSHPLPVSMRDFVVRRRDGLPAYHLCSVVDDSYFGVDLVVRGADLFESTIAQLHLARLLGLQRFTNATFVHHRLLRAPSGEKLSKSAGDTSVQYLRRSGATAQEVYGLVGQLAGIGSISHWHGLSGQVPELLQ